MILEIKLNKTYHLSIVRDGKEIRVYNFGKIMKVKRNCKKGESVKFKLKENLK